MPQKRSAMRGDFRYERKAQADGTLVWEVYRRREHAWWKAIGIARATGSRRYPWEGVRAGSVVCPRYRSRELVAYCLLRAATEEES